MNNRATLAAAVAGGYVLGRTKKARLAIGVGSYLLTKHYRLDPRKLANESVRRLGSSPQMARLTNQVRQDVASAGKRAVSAAVERRAGSLADRLENRADELTTAGTDDSGSSGGSTKGTKSAGSSGTSKSRASSSGGAKSSGGTKSSGGAKSSGNAKSSGGSRASGRSKSSGTAKSSGRAASSRTASKGSRSRSTTKEA